MKSSNLLSIKHLAIFFIALMILQPRELKAQFANGADISWLSQMEDAGYIFKDNTVIQKNCLDILKEKGIITEEEFNEQKQKLLNKD